MYQLAALCSSNELVSISEATLHRARLLVGWVNRLVIKPAAGVTQSSTVCGMSLSFLAEL